MGFTRSTTDISVHQKLDDYPNRDDGLTPEEIKKRYDYPAETLQKDLNKLEEELEKYNAAQSIGADSIHGNDESDANVQAKLMEIYRQLEKVILNQIPDNTITKQKLNSDYSSIIAEKTGDVQLNLNAEKVDGLTGAEIREMKTITETYTGDGTKVRVIDLGFTPKAVLVQPNKQSTSANSTYPYEGG
jgi:septation ring formation regulator EzrA